MIYALDGVAPEVSPGAWIAADANLVGRVAVAAGASIWFGSTLRGDNEPISVGEGSNVQDGCVLHTDPGFPLVIGRDCTIGHRAVLHGCTIGDETLVGMSATVLNGARLGRNCLVGAGALVTEGKEFPDGVLVMGAPARAVRDLTADEIGRLRAAADVYRRRAEHYRRALRTA